jgi:hypothetical protein
MLTSIQGKDSRGWKERLRRTSNFKVLEEGLLDQPLQNIICHNCKQRHHLIERNIDTNNLFCTHCGALTPIRSVKHSRGLAAPAIQSGRTAIAQPKRNVAMGRNRLPSGIHNNKQRNPIEQMLIDKGFEIVDSQSIEPVPVGGGGGNY